MNLSCLTSLLSELPTYRQLVGELREQGGERRVVAMDAAKPYLLAWLFQQLHLPLLVITPLPENARRLYEQLLVWCPGEAPVLLFPEPDALPYEPLPPDPVTQQRRLQVLSRLKELRQNSGSMTPLVITSASAAVRKIIPYNHFASACMVLRQGVRIDPLVLLSKWQDMGYERDTTVEVPGTMSHRGGIVDIYPPNSDFPLRIEFFGEEIESLRSFDPATQRSQKTIPSATIVPAQESVVAPADIILDYLPPDTLLVLDEPAEIEAAARELDTQATQIKQGLMEKGELPQDTPRPYLLWSELKERLDGVKQRLALTRWQAETDTLPSFSSAPSYGGRLQAFLKEAKQRLKEGYRLIITSYQAARLSELLEEEGIFASPLSDLPQPPSPGSLALIQGSLSEGWTIGGTILLTDAELFGFVKQRRLAKRRPVRREGFLSELSVGDYAVHIEHGIARFAGTTRIRVDSAERDYLILEYAAGDRLYVPTDQADRVSRYIGPGGIPPALSRLGSQEWSRVKQRVKDAANHMAQDLLNLYAAREVILGFSFSSDSVWQQELEASFPYIETADQLEAVYQIKEDMEKSKPMDRLVCGDVGYGKTEVALRAAFKAVMDGKQVAMLVPTTVLAQQHFMVFSQRLGAFPLKVEMLSRFRSEKEQQAILTGLANGSIDICIGTHRLLQKDVVFKNLGLVIIDEEQRFGVAHKERLKQMRREVDVLTLSATPIPRTLHMSLVGVRDMSTMETPPEERLPIKTYVANYDERLIREAIMRELERNGQVFFVHNRVQTIPRVASRLRELIPEARIAIAHGQMPEEALERVMLDFAQGKIDVLVCTTIIESGLDIPNVNTLIVNESDKLGLAQLYQLRGRVGRGTSRAYAYFLYARGKRLTPAAEKRLQTIFEATELGAGFRIAMKDLEIRGAGNLLGPEQSGHIAAVGFDLYCQLLAEAVEELKTKRTGEKKAKEDVSFLPTIDLPLSAYLPHDYVADLNTRLALYHRLSRLRSPKEVKGIKEEFDDRFGKLPPPVENLLYAVNIKLLAAQAGVQSISTEDKQVVIKFREGIFPYRAKLEPAGKGVKLGTTQIRLDIKQLGNRWQEVLGKVVKLLAF